MERIEVVEGYQVMNVDLDIRGTKEKVIDLSFQTWTGPNSEAQSWPRLRLIGPKARQLYQQLGEAIARQEGHTPPTPSGSAVH